MKTGSKTAQHTPEPWQYEGKTMFGRDADGEFVAILRYEWEPKDADARLIAAAPDLLAALVDLLAHHDSIPAQYITEQGHQRADEARAAILRATAGGK